MKTATLVGVGILSSMLSAATIAAPPQITSFSPTSGPVGTIVTIAGSDFNTTASNNVVFFGATSITRREKISRHLRVSLSQLIKSYIGFGVGLLWIGNTLPISSGIWAAQNLIVPPAASPN